VSVGLLVLVLCVAAVLLQGSRTDSAEALLAPRYELGPLPGEFRLDPRGHRLPGGEQLVRFAGPGADDEAILRSAAGLEAGPEPTPGGRGAPAVDWSALAPDRVGESPSVIYLVRYPLASGERVMREQFQRIEYRDLSRLEPKGGSTPVEGGELDWHGYSADHVRVRRFGPGPTFRDVVRVNLSLGRECWIAHAVWPPLSEGSIEPVGELLRALRPRRD
jgi:hypothetical protein